MSDGWVIGWTAGGAAVAVAAALLIDINLRARRIAAQAREVAEGLERARANTARLFDVRSTNAALERTARALTGGA